MDLGSACIGNRLNALLRAVPTCRSWSEELGRAHAQACQERISERSEFGESRKRWYVLGATCGDVSLNEHDG